MKYITRILIVIFIILIIYLLFFFGSIFLDLSKYDKQLKEINNIMEENNKQFTELRSTYINDINNIQDSKTNEVIPVYKNY